MLLRYLYAAYPSVSVSPEDTNNSLEQFKLYPSYDGKLYTPWQIEDKIDEQAKWDYLTKAETKYQIKIANHENEVCFGK